MTAAAGGTGFDPTTVIDGRAWRMTLGLRRLDPSAWLLSDEHRDSELAEKARLLREQRDEVVAELPAGAAAARELLALVAADPARMPGPVDLATPDPIAAVALLAQEDFCVLTRDEVGQWLLTAACVCFPSRWRLSRKMGRTVTGIHEPVPGYGAIAGPVDAFFDRLTPDRPMWRTNWTILDDPALFQQEGRDRPPPVAMADTIFRVERQTLRALPHTGAVVFTIRTYRRSLAGIRRRDPAAAHALAETLSGVSREDATYKGWPDLPGLIRWLRTAPSS